jgi:hypothetical protein
MKKLIDPVIMIAGAVALAGCVASTTDVVDAGAVNGTNGLPFASGDVTGGGTLSTAVTGRTASTSSVSYAAGSGGGSFQQNSITVVGVDADTIRITYNGATAELKRIGTSEGFIGIDGRTYHILERTQPGSEVSAYRYVRSGSLVQEDDGFFRFVVGNITNAANLSGTASYSVLLSGSGSELANGRVRGLDIRGTGTIGANFATNAINGTMRVGTSDSGTNTNLREEQFSITGTRTGAAFTSTAVRTDCPVTDTCTSNTNLSGNFYGQNGREIAGVGILRETRTSSSGPVETSGSFTFINK